ncbi:MAG: LytS/YhcK type 5TM receptor domain-containing protein [Fusobacterium sp. JB019]|nr:LytS/YhcK type 5TM receptor domain-containing protein [Fusobacterium sp. JB020]MDP0505721.1 LytS/YhcK type 5TM receptor domain-containing protein [Fusobacterium sp. JB019]
MFNLGRTLVNNLGYIIVISFFFARFTKSRSLFSKEKYTKKEILFLSLFFGCLAILGTYSGVDYKGAIANTRNIGVIVGGILIAPQVGIFSGIIAGIHRYFLNAGEVTSLACTISTIFGGFLSAYIYKYKNEKNIYFYGFLNGFIVENLSMFLILVLAKDEIIAKQIVGKIYFPMILSNSLGIPIVIYIIKNIIDEREMLAGKQAMLSLEIANKTLPYFMKGENLNEVCKIIMESLGAKTVVLSNRKNIIASYCYNDSYKIEHTQIKSEIVKRVIETDKLYISNKMFNKNEFLCVNGDVKSCIIAPLHNGTKVSGTLKIYFDRFEGITESNRLLVLGLSQLISTQLELSKIEKLETMAKDANLKMLQTQINPHFLFNALNTISSFIRMNPEKARQIILDLSTFLRFNLDELNKEVTVEKELEQVKAYVNIEKARFGDKINVEYNIDDASCNLNIPSLIIQPLVENSIKHGILKKNEGGNVLIEIHCDDENKLNIKIIDDGIGISEEIIEKLKNNKLEKGIGLKNVHNRLELIYGKGLEIKRLKEGTEISFKIKCE